MAQILLSQFLPVACKSNRAIDHPTLWPQGAQPSLNWKPLSRLGLILEAHRITIDVCRDALVYFKGQFNFDAFGLNSFLISRNCSQFNWCQLLALYSSPLPACCAAASLFLMILSLVRVGRGKRGRGASTGKLYKLEHDRVGGYLRQCRQRP